ncbi:MAG: class I SAM-dependent DNA methyltransferase [Methanosphaera stadtmanae]|nr:class I SAM-dependent DNA methyltransferase [Methanosphaera stadtmanae]
MKESLIKTCEFDWSEISPAIFGSIFQNAMDEQLRRELGSHFTSETNVKKVINSLFMDELWEEYNKSKRNPKKLEQLNNKIGQIKIFDPACGSGNFLIIAYRELRLLEYEILKTLREEDQIPIEHYFEGSLTKIKLKNFYGIEILEFPSKIAQVAMWIVEHQMNQKYKRKFNIDHVDLPLKSSVNIYNTNALQIDWKEILKPTDDVYILGNPPFTGKKFQTREQKEDVKKVFEGYKNIKELDYVSCWYKKSADYIEDTGISVAFVSTNSICQGEQCPLLWDILLNDYNLSINFAHT